MTRTGRVGGGWCDHPPSGPVGPTWSRRKGLGSTVHFELSMEDLERLAALAHLQADTLAENGDAVAARVPAGLAARLDWAASVGRKEQQHTALVVV